VLGLSGAPIKITSLTTGKHSPNSYHYRGMAVDFKLLGKHGLNRNQIVQNILKAGFNGVGVYSTFYHADLRPKTLTALWKRKAGKYLPLITWR
ncbi:hypothetical protein ACFL5V_11680, partial [Fibrobacterota bacterium]